MGVAHCIKLIFEDKYFVACFSTTKTTKILSPKKTPLYGIRMTHADKEFHYASCNLALEIKGKFIGANTWYIPLKLLEF